MSHAPVSIWLAAVPLAGAAAGLLIRSRTRALKAWVLLVSLAPLPVLMALDGQTNGSAGAAVLLPGLLSVAAFVSILAQLVEEEGGTGWLMTLVLLGLGLGALADGRAGLIPQAALLGLLGAQLYRHRRVSGSLPLGGIVVLSVGLASLMVAWLAVPPVSALARLVACATLLPLVPFHGGYVAAFRGLPGNLPAFLAVLLPAVGFHDLLTVLPELSIEWLGATAMLALAGAVFGSLKALTQTRVRLTVGYAGVSLLAILWWYVAATGTAPPQTLVYLLAVGFVTSGFLLAWHAVQARYGEVDLRGLRGLAYPMPTFSTLVFLLTLAAIGLPPFGVYAGVMGMLLTPSLPLSGALVIIIGTLLITCWYVLGLAQRLLFGRPRPDLRYQDLHMSETASLVLVLVLLVALGLVPPRLLGSGPPAPQAHVTESTTWNR